MRLMLGTKDSPSLLVYADNDYDPTNFEFEVINGAWSGKYTNGYITVFGAPCGEYSSLAKLEIICDNQDRLRGDYNEVFANFDNPEYVAPNEFVYTLGESEDDNDIPF